MDDAFAIDEKILRTVNPSYELHVPCLPEAKELFLSHVIIHGIPNFDAAPNGGCTPFLQIVTAPTQEEKCTVIYNSAWESPYVDTYTEDPDGCILVRIGRKVSGDILLRCFHVEQHQVMGRHTTEMFYVHFHTSFLMPPSEDVGVYRLLREEIDEAHSKRFADSFFIDLVFDQPDETTASNSSAADRRLSSDDILLGNRPKPKMGWLIKQGGFIRNWKRRWFVLRDGHISYFSNATDPTPLGVVNVANAHLETCSSEEIRAPYANYHYFKIVPKSADERVYYLGAASESQMAEWITAIAREISLLDFVRSRAPSMSKNLDVRRSGSKRTAAKRLFGRALHRRSISQDVSTVELIKTSRGIPTGVSAEVVTNEVPIDRQSQFTYVYTRDELLALSGLQDMIMQHPHLFHDFARMARSDKDALLAKIIEMIVENCPILLDAFNEDPDQVAELLIQGCGIDVHKPT